MAALAEFIELYKTDYNLALEWIQKNEIDSISWEQLYELGELIKPRRGPYSFHFFDEHSDYSAMEAIRRLSEKAANQLALLPRDRSSFIKLVKLNGGFAYDVLLLDQVSAYFKTFEDFMELIQAVSDQDISVKYMADALIKDQPKYFASLIKNHNQFAEIYKAFISAGFCLTMNSWVEADPPQFASFFLTYDSFIETVNTVGEIPKCLLYPITDHILALFKKAEQLTQLARSAHNAHNLIDIDPAKFISLLQSRDSLLNLLKSNWEVAHSLIMKDPKKFALFFENYEQFIELTSVSSIDAALLVSADPRKFTSFIENTEHFVELANKSFSRYNPRSPIYKLIEEDSQAIAALFNTPEKLLQLKQLVNQHVFNKFCLKHKKDSKLISDKSTKVENTEKDAVSDDVTTDYSFLVDVLSSIVMGGGAALLIAGLVLTQLPLLIAGASIALTGLATLTMNRFGLFACGAVDGSKVDDNTSQVVNN